MSLLTLTRTFSLKPFRSQWPFVLMCRYDYIISYIIHSTTELVYISREVYSASMRIPKCLLKIMFNFILKNRIPLPFYFIINIPAFIFYFSGSIYSNIDYADIASKQFTLMKFYPLYFLRNSVKILIGNVSSGFGMWPILNRRQTWSHFNSENAVTMSGTTDTSNYTLWHDHIWKSYCHFEYEKGPRTL